MNEVMTSMNENKWALLIGINRYQHTATPTLHDLNGPVKDVADMREMLQRIFGFKPPNIVTLTDEAATRTMIIQAIKTHLVANAQVNDTVVIHFSGHGSYKIRDGVREGTLVAHDSRGPTGSDLDGSALSAAFREIAARNVTVVLDSCHSGNLIESRCPASRQIVARSAPPDNREDEQDLPEERAAFRGNIRVQTEHTSFALLSAAGPHESAFERELEGKCRGVFTYCFTRELRRMGAMVTYRDVMDRVRVLVSSWFVGQTPQLEGGLRDRFIFSENKCVTLPYVLVEPAKPGCVHLAAGRASGITPGSLYAVYEPGEKMLSGGKPIATIEVIEATASTSLARKLSGEEIPPASRAVEIEHRSEGYRVLVRLPKMDELVERLRHYQHLELDCEQCNGGREADIALVACKGFLQIQLAGFGAELPSVPPVKLTLPEAERMVLHWAKWFNILRLHNEDGKLDLDFRIQPIPVEPAVDGSLPAPVFYDNGGIRYVIENKSGRNLFVGLLALADDGSASMVFPPASGSRLLPDGGKFEGTLHVDRLEDRESEFNVLKLFAAVQQCDYGLLELDGLSSEATRSVPLNALEQLLAEAAFGRARKIRASARSDEWTTKQHNVPIYRRS